MNFGHTWGQALVPSRFPFLLHNASWAAACGCVEPGKRIDMRAGHSQTGESMHHSRRITDWPEEDRPREKVLKQEVSRLTDAELLAIIIGTGHAQSGGNALDLARMLLSGFGSLRAMSAAGVGELLGYSGIGQAKAARVKAALALGDEQSADVVPHLVEAISDRSAVVRAAAAEALGNHRGPAVIGALKAGLTDKDSTVVAAALRAMGRQKETRVLAVLEEHLLKGSVDEMLAAIDANVLAENEGAVKSLERLLDHDNKNLQAAAWRALKRLTGREYDVDQ